MTVAVSDSRSSKTKVSEGELRGYGSPRERRKSKHRMRRASRIFSGKMNWLDRFNQLQDKKWWALILLGCVLIGAAVLFALQIALEWMF